MEQLEPTSPAANQSADSPPPASEWSTALRGTDHNLFGNKSDSAAPNGQGDEPAPQPAGPSNAAEQPEDSPPPAGGGNVIDPPEPPTPPSPGAESPDEGNGNEEDFNSWTNQIENNEPFINVGEGETVAVAEGIIPIPPQQLQEVGNRIEIYPGSPLIVSRSPSVEITSELIPGDYSVLASNGDTVAALNLRDGDISAETTGQDLDAVCSMFKSVNNLGPGTEIFITAPSDPNAPPPPVSSGGGTIELEWSRSTSPSAVGSNLEHLKHSFSQQFPEDKIAVVAQGEIQQVSTSADGITHVLTHKRDSNVSLMTSRQHGGTTDAQPFKLQVPHQGLDNWFITESSNSAAPDWIPVQGADRIASEQPHIDYTLNTGNFVSPDLYASLNVNDHSYSASAKIDRVQGVMDVTSLPDTFNLRDTQGLDPGANLVERLVHVARDLGCKQIAIPTARSKFMDNMALLRVDKRLLPHITVPPLTQLAGVYDANAKRFGFNRMDANQEKHWKDL